MEAVDLLRTPNASSNIYWREKGGERIKQLKKKSLGGESLLLE